MRVLGIESSCDDTGIALIDGTSIVTNIVLKQEHKLGVVPEYAARSHHEAIFEYAQQIIGSDEIDLVAYTAGPGLIGSLFVGACFAKGLAFGWNKPSIGVNHLEAHIILPHWMDSTLEFPYLCMLISGGHTMIVLVKNLGEYEILCKTLDDAVGETFDKIARHIGLEYPGGPNIEKLAARGTGVHMHQFQFPNSMHNRDEFSFSGLKTAAIMAIDRDADIEMKFEFCYQLQTHIAIILTNKMERLHNRIEYPVKNWVISGGVAANNTIRSHFAKVANSYNVQIHYPPIELCTDNGLMIAALGQLRFEKYGPTNFNQKISSQMPL